jgi:FlgD Ig-like domain/Metallo-peptidase family M12B Reprolysin-like
MSMFPRSFRLAIVVLGALPAASHAAERASVAMDDARRPTLRQAIAGPGCGSTLTPQEAAAYLELRDVHPVPDGELLGGPYFVPIAPHIVRHSNGTGGLPESRYQQAIADANGHYAPVGITFYTAGAIDYIDSDAFYTTSSLDEINDLRTTNTVPDAINIYFTENLDYENGSLCGISAFTFSSVQAIAMRNSCTANPAGLGNHSTFSHEVGHYFNLFHTHETALGEEYVDGSNCDVAGDELCDTPADPVLTSGTVSSSTCMYTGNATDGHGDPYDPDCTLLMSYSLKHCRDTFTPQSYVRIEDTLVNERPELITNPGNGVPEQARARAGVTLAAPRPNPAAGISELRFTLDAPSRVEIAVFDVRGARVRTIAKALYAEGEHTAGWDGLDATGRAVTPGIYFARLAAGEQQLTRKIQRLR